MISFFSRAAENEHLDGPLELFAHTQQLFASDERSGMIEIEVSADERLIYLYLTGQILGSYRLMDERAELIDPTAPLAMQEIKLRYLRLPDQGVRAVWQALEWYPPVRGARLDVPGLAAYMDVLRSEGGRGQLYLSLPDLDGFLLFADGALVNAETVLATGRGFLDSLPTLRSLTAGAAGVGEVWLSDLRLDAPSGQLADLRLAFVAWVSGVINGYQGLVGSNLVTPLDHAINTWIRPRQFNLRLVGASLIDHHIFVSTNQAVTAYRGVSVQLSNHMAQVIGDQLAARILADAYMRLKVARRKTLDHYTLAPLVSI